MTAIFSGRLRAADALAGIQPGAGGLRHQDAATAGRRRRRDAVAPNRHEPRTFWIVVPALNEERVVGQTVRAALALSGPAGTRTRVLVVDDGSDDGTPDVLAAIDHPDLTVLRRDLPNARKGKGEALNAAFRRIRELTLAAGRRPGLVAVGVIDGDGRGSANMLVEVSRPMRDPEVGAVQCRVRIHNRNRLLGAVQDLEFACIANASQLLRNALGTVGLGGNGQFARLSVADAARRRAVVRTAWSRTSNSGCACTSHGRPHPVHLAAPTSPSRAWSTSPAAAPAHPVGAGQPAVRLRTCRELIASRADPQPRAARDAVLPARAVDERDRHGACSASGRSRCGGCCPATGRRFLDHAPGRSWARRGLWLLA